MRRIKRFAATQSPTSVASCRGRAASPSPTAACTLIGRGTLRIEPSLIATASEQANINRDSLGDIMWTNNGALGSTDIWNYGPTFLADGSFLIWKQTSPASLPCRYSMSSKSYALSWCAKQPTSPYVWAEAPFIALPSSVATLVVDAKHSSREFVVGVGSFSTQGGALGWIGTPVANYTGDNEPMAYSPAADPTGA